MAKHKIRIEYVERQGTIDNIVFDVEPNNLSSSGLNDLTNVNAYQDLFLLNLSDLSGKYKYFSNNKVKYYISSVFSDESSNINIGIDVTTTKSNSITLVFSKDYYPTLIEVNGIEYNNSDNTFQISIPSLTQTTTKIRVLKMNKPNIPLIITNINTGITIDYDETYIINFTRGSQLSTDNEIPKYELVSQYGNCRFIDSDNVVINLKVQGLLEKPKSIQLLLDDELIGKYTVQSWAYNTENNVVDVDFSDSLEKSAKENVEEYFEDTNEFGGINYLHLFEHIKEKLISRGETFEPLSESVESWISSIKTIYIKYDSMSLNDLVVNFCNATQTTIYKNQKGNLEVYLWR